MKALIASGVVALSLLAAGACAAGEFTFQVTDPDFSVKIPSLPQMKMDIHPMRAGKPHLRYLGSSSPYSVSIMTPTADAGMTAIDCAGSLLKSLASRPGVPELSRVYKAKVNERTFVAIYASPHEGFVQLHAHLMSAASPGYCIEVHASKVSTSQGDIEPWFKGFSDADVRAGQEIQQR